MAPGLREAGQKRLLRKDWIETVSTNLVRRFDVIRVEDLKIRHLVRSARGTTELPGTNVRAKACGHCDPKDRESQTVFRCRVCGHLDHADVNAAKNIAAGRAVTARGGRPVGRPVNREPQLAISSA